MRPRRIAGVAATLLVAGAAAVVLSGCSIWQVQGVNAGDNLTCEVKTDHTVACWGDNTDGDLGDGTLEPSWTPTTVSGITTAVAVAVGGDHACALLSTQGVVCWGGDEDGQLGDGGTTKQPTPIPVPGLTGVISLASGNDYTCAVLAAGGVDCWGLNTSGQLGDGTTTNRSTPVAVAGLTTATAVTARSAHTCALLANHTIDCWGDGGAGDLGNGTSYQITPAPSPVTGITDAVAVDAGDNQTCAVRASGGVDCWGYNVSGQLGDGTTTARDTPVPVTGITDAVAVTGGIAHTCALLSDHTVACWGDNSDGQLGDGADSNPHLTPFAVPGIHTATAITAEAWTTCALLANHAVDCWGQPGQLGTVTGDGGATPVAVAVPGPIGTVSAEGAGGDSCAVVAGGSVLCWGDNSAGELGDGHAETVSAAPVVVKGISTATQVTVGDEHACALLGSGQVDCWGDNSSGQLGDGGPEATSPTPVPVAGITTAVAVTAGGSHTCARLASGTVSCWGDNSSGQLGDGGPEATSPTPVSVSGLIGATGLAAGADHTCAVVASGGVVCWGDNASGDLGDGTNTPRPTPVAVSGLTGATAVTAGGAHTCALLPGGSAECWGYNLYGQLGDTTDHDRPTPVAVAGLTGATSITAGGTHTCALLGNGTADCWGDNIHSQLGDGVLGSDTTQDRWQPGPVVGLTGATSVVAGDNQSCAVLSDQTTTCWGADAMGQLGDGNWWDRPIAGRPVAGMG